MAFLIDTSVIIGLRERDERIGAKIAQLGGPAAISIITQVELEAGVFRFETDIASRRAELDKLLANLPALVFDGDCARAYGRIIAAAGYSRRKVLDRMIAAQALVHGLTLVTVNAEDFADIPGLPLLAW